MRTAVVSSFPFPDGKATANRVRIFAETLVNNDLAEEVIIFSTSSAGSNVTSFAEKIKVVTIYVPTIDKRKLFFRAVTESIVAFKLLSSLKNFEIDRVLVTIPSTLLLLPLLMLPKRVKLVLDVRDAVWTYLRGGTFQRIAGILVSILFKFVARKAAFVSVTNFTEAKSVEKLCNIKAVIAGNGISNLRLRELASIRSRVLGSQVNVTYIGNVGIAQELDILIRFAQHCNDEIIINIVGDGAMLSELSGLCLRKKISNVIFHGAVSADKVAGHIEKADVLFAQIGKNYESAVPTKIFEYLASGRRVLLGLPDGPAKKIFEEFDAVEIYPSGNLDRMNKSYEKLTTQKFDFDYRSKNLSLLKSKYLREKTIGNFLTRFKNL